MALLSGGSRPAAGDWKAAVVVTPAHALWTDAASSGAKGHYYVALLVGSYKGTALAPEPRSARGPRCTPG
ncbi:hypothetical protein ACQP1V_28900 [Microtetraspora malaysiensis]|uniref:hypothetical protein n=1 Tax=Microtetraspora malaysiensis TaxID=161358 RepID=UPI003D8B40E4